MSEPDEHAPIATAIKFVLHSKRVYDVYVTGRLHAANCCIHI